MALTIVWTDLSFEPATTIDAPRAANKSAAACSRLATLSRPASIAEAQYAAAEQDLVLRVTEAYFNVLNAQDTLNLARNKKTLIKEQLEQAKRNFEVGTATITDTHEAQSRYDLVVAQELAAEADLLIKRSALEQLTGTSIGNLKSLSSQAKIEIIAKDRKIKLKNNQKPSKVNIENAVAVQPNQDIQGWIKQAEDVSYTIIASKLAYEIAQKDKNTPAGPTNLKGLQVNPATGQTIGWNGTGWVDAKTGKPYAPPVIP